MTHLSRLLLTAALTSLLGVAAALGGDGPVCPATPAADGCPSVPCKVCRPTSEVKKTTKYIYACKEEDICLPRCGGLFSRSCDESCTTAKVRTVRRLVKKPITEEKCETKWIVERIVPGCVTP